MIDLPISIKNYTPIEANFRLKEDRSKMLGDALIRTKSFVTEKVRVLVGPINPINIAYYG
jgi:hypothetical protein